jgi:hypothetical protein
MIGKCEGSEIRGHNAEFLTYGRVDSLAARHQMLYPKSPFIQETGNRHSRSPVDCATRRCCWWGSPAASAAPNWRGCAGIRPKEWSLLCGDRRPTRKGREDRWPCLMVRIRSPVRCARYAPGWMWRRSPRAALSRRRSVWDGVGAGALSGLGGLDREAGGRTRRSERHRLRRPQPARRPSHASRHERRQPSWPS